MRHALIIAFILFQNSLIYGQNLVKNPSFEEFNKCPEGLGNMTEDATSWSVSTYGTTDYFNECSDEMGVPNNFSGEQTAQFGKGYAGLYMMAPNDYREYLQAELIQPLVKGERYSVSFYISLAEKSMFAVQDIGVLFSEKKMNEPTRKHLTKPKGKDSFNHLEISKSNYFADKSEWMLVTSEIVARGTETFLTIGNFRNNMASSLKKMKGKKLAAYYYIDMVSVTPAYQGLFSRPLSADKVYVFENVLFKTDDYQLDEIAKNDLEKLYKELKKDSTLYVHIDAHTDSDGSSTHNEKLSSNRAISVSKYLTSLGLSKRRVFWMGHGGKRPVSDNNTNEGKQKNRRVEFIISKEKGLGTASTMFEGN
ncbi:MAG: OmpA family protein [Maribacter sp.]|nr:OmpA family protein [Maribacter sp.]